MSFFENMATDSLSGALSNSSNSLARNVLEMINQHPDGLSGMVQTFREKGLGDVVNSWVGTGQNLPISSDQISDVFGSERVQALASQVGLTPDTLNSQISSLLPNLVDVLTPNGKLPNL